MNSYPVHIEDGWYDLEYDSVNSEYFRWNSAVSYLLFSKELLKVRLILRKTPLAPSQKLVVEFKTGDSREFELRNGDNFIDLGTISSGKLKLQTSSFTPKYVIPGCTDTRTIGVQLIKIQYSDDDGETVDIKSEDIILSKAHDQINELLKDCNADLVFRNDYGMVYLKFNHQKSSGKVNLGTQLVFSAHRSGWAYVMKLLSIFHNGNGVLLDGFVEDTFLWKPRLGFSTDPYTCDWVGFLHQPYGDSSQYVMSEPFQKSLKACRGLFTFSEHNKLLLKHAFPELKIDCLFHPTRPTQLTFSMERFRANKNKKLVQTGNHMRYLPTFYKMQSPYRKIHLTPGNRQDYSLYTELESLGISSKEKSSVRMFERIENKYYDRLMSENIGFLHLSDCCASNFIIECMMRATPLLINPLPAVVEYLGKDYPLYFNDIKDAESKIQSEDIIEDTHKYLIGSGVVEKIMPDRFISDLSNSPVYVDL